MREHPGDRRAISASQAIARRSRAPLVLALGLVRLGAPVAVVTVQPSPLSRLALHVSDGPGGNRAVLGAFGLDDADALLAAADAALQAGRPAAVLVDDGEQVDRTPLEPVLRKLLDRLPSSGEVVVLAGSTPQLLGRFHGVSAQVRKGATGLLLGPAGTLDGDLFAVRTPRTVERRPGRGLLVRRARLVAVQVADPGDSELWQEDE